MATTDKQRDRWECGRWGSGEDKRQVGRVTGDNVTNTDKSDRWGIRV